METPLHSLRTRVLKADRYVCTPAWANHGQLLPGDPFGRIYFLRSGGGQVTHHGRTILLRPGTLTAIPAFTPCAYVCPRRMDQVYIHFTATVFGGLEPFASLGWPYQVLLREPERIRRIVDGMVAADRARTPAATLAGEGLLRLLLAEFAAAPVARPPRVAGVERLQPIFAFVARNLSDRITLADLARQVHLQPTYFSNLFTATMGFSPMTYVLRQRVERAQGMLRLSDAKLQEVAESVGFRDAFYFSRVFTRFTGLRPSAYRHATPAEGSAGKVGQVDSRGQIPDSRFQKW
jgi:AraC-like DNA-binding protein